MTARLGQRFKAAHQGGTVVCQEYGVLYHHEFDRDPADWRITFDARQVERCRSKLTYKMGNLIRVCESGQEILFIRWMTVTDAPGDRFQLQP